MQDKRPGLVESFGARGFDDVAAHNESLLECLSQALAVGQPILFDDHVGWLKCAFVARGAPLEPLRESLLCLRDELQAELPANAARTVAGFIEGAIAHLERAPERTPSSLEGDAPHVELARLYLLALLEGRRFDAIEIAVGAVDQGLSVPDLYKRVLAAAQIELGLMWQRGEIHVAEEHLASRITEQVLAIVSARMPRAHKLGKRVLVTSAHGDLHDIGLRMVADHFEMAGWEAINLGASTPPDAVVRALKDFEIDLLAISAKQTVHLRAASEMIAAVRAATARSHVPILVGGAPFALVPDLWKVIGADGAALSAIDAVEAGTRLVARQR
jgi:MerR family transcriptional regulator, light-induced transcriptional regulator